MKLFQKASDGGKESGVDAFFLVEIKSLFSIALLRFSNGTREAYHSHAFNALTLWLKGKVREHHIGGATAEWKAGDWKYTPRHVFHQVESIGTTWALTFRGPWMNEWYEYRGSKLLVLTNGRKVVRSYDAAR
jgi:quercetin dioxygenase-like cupin family protein